MISTHKAKLTRLQVQDIVVGNKNFTDVTKPSQIVQLLLNDEQLASLEASDTVSGKKGKRSAAVAHAEGEPVRDLWNEEGDDFFGHSTAAAGGAGTGETGDDDKPPAPKGRKKKAGTAGTTRARKTVTKAKK